MNTQIIHNLFPWGEVEDHVVSCEDMTLPTHFVKKPHKHGYPKKLQRKLRKDKVR